MDLRTISLPKNVKEVIANPIPQSVIFKKPGKGDLNYISITYVTDTLNAAFGHLGWSWENKNTWVKDSEIYFKKDSKYSKAPEDKAVINDNGDRGMFISQPPVVHVEGRLTVKLWDEEKKCFIESYREACGSKVLIGSASEQDSAYKSAQSDAMKKAASFFGVGLELARKEPEKEYFEELNAEPLELVWTDELKAKYQEQWDMINTVLDANGWSVNDLSYYVHLTTDGLYADLEYMPENYLDAFIDNLKEENLIA